ncbi:MAG TPA: glucuronate isomerase [Eubacteriales bacterium]|nr:glucuronate isomerase [Eubacteriales bacterium]
MKHAFSEDLFLTNKTGKRLYETYAKGMPIIDYHCHLLPQEIYENKQFTDLGEMWLAHDHYKWRAMRTFGVDERLITGDASFFEKFKAFAEIMPELIGNPLYIWCALELKRFFGIDEPLCAENAEKIYEKTKALIAEKHMCPRWCMECSNVEVVCTTEDPVDDLHYHKLLAEDASFRVKVYSAFRPDKAMNCEKAPFKGYIGDLEVAAGKKIGTFEELIAALEKRLQVFKGIGSTISDAGLDNFVWTEATAGELDAILKKARGGEPLSAKETNQFRSAFLLHMGRVYARNGFVMQIHIGAYRNANGDMAAKLGPDTGYDCTDSASDIRSMSALLDALNREGNLPKVILYPLNASDAEPYAILAAAFCKEPGRGNVQLGASWWFNDQAHGIQRQFEAVSNLYPVSLSVGMLTDSRSFLSYPRHELYRRVFCNYLGSLVERGEYFSDEKYLKKIIENVCYQNAKAYFGL